MTVQYVRPACGLARTAREEAEAAEQWKREMAMPPTLGAVLEVKRWTLADVVVDRCIVERTYANRTVQATTDSGEQVCLDRNEYTGDWHIICGQSTSMRLPCRGGAASVRCRVQHKPGLHLREDSPWA